jgi:hypothetical protein
MKTFWANENKELEITPNRISFFIILKFSAKISFSGKEMPKI